MDCLFCQIINKEVPSYPVYEDENFYAFLDIFPKNQGHTLLVPKICVKDMLNAKHEMSAAAHAVIQKINFIFEKKLKSKGLTVIINNNLGQEVPHLHWHLIPRFNKENYALPKTTKIDLEKLSKKLV